MPKAANVKKKERYDIKIRKGAVPVPQTSYDEIVKYSFAHNNQSPQKKGEVKQPDIIGQVTPGQEIDRKDSLVFTA